MIIVPMIMMACGMVTTMGHHPRAKVEVTKVPQNYTARGSEGEERKLKEKESHRRETDAKENGARSPQRLGLVDLVSGHASKTPNRGHGFFQTSPSFNNSNKKSRTRIRSRIPLKEKKTQGLHKEYQRVCKTIFLQYSYEKIFINIYIYIYV